MSKGWTSKAHEFPSLHSLMMFVRRFSTKEPKSTILFVQSRILSNSWNRTAKNNDRIYHRQLAHSSLIIELPHELSSFLLNCESKGNTRLSHPPPNEPRVSLLTNCLPVSQPAETLGKSKSLHYTRPQRIYPHFNQSLCLIGWLVYVCVGDMGPSKRSGL